MHRSSMPGRGERHFNSAHSKLRPTLFSVLAVKTTPCTYARHGLFSIASHPPTSLLWLPPDFCPCCFGLAILASGPRYACYRASGLVIPPKPVYNLFNCARAGWQHSLFTNPIPSLTAQRPITPKPSRRPLSIGGLARCFPGSPRGLAQTWKTAPHFFHVWASVGGMHGKLRAR